VFSIQSGDLLNSLLKRAVCISLGKEVVKMKKSYLEGGRCIIAVDEAFFRPAEVGMLLGDPSKAKNTLGRFPEISFQETMEGDLKKKRSLPNSFLSIRIIRTCS
jgi:GDP-D-mannose dehydratase